MSKWSSKLIKQICKKYQNTFQKMKNRRLTLETQIFGYIADWELLERSLVK